MVMKGAIFMQEDEDSNNKGLTKIIFLTLFLWQNPILVSKT